jgi:predicted CoA-binding protein
MGKMMVLGATDNPQRYSCKAVKSLARNGYEVVAVGIRPGLIKSTHIQPDITSEIEILAGTPEVGDVDTVLLYMGEKKQKEYYDYLLRLKPRRVIFNPGSENGELQEILEAEGIETVKDCALIMINTDTF